jgi:tripeptidyl-peptidase-2
MQRVFVVLALWIPTAAGCVWADTGEPWTQLSLSTCKVDQFLRSHPEQDGRGVVVAVLDTGVDPSIPGLTRTSEGEVKVIDVQDFTGQGDIELRRVPTDPETGMLIHYDDEGVPIEYTPPDVRIAGQRPTYWFGLFEEKTLVNSGVPDVNDNGKTDDEFPICVVAYPGGGDDDALCFVDTNLDRSFADEKPLRNYRLDFDTFTLHRDKPEKQIVPLTFAVNIFLREKKVVIHYDDGAHGTHVAGIAAGYDINNQPGFNGVAPGAKIMSLKIGQNAVGGISVTGSKQKAIEYAARYARENRVPVVINLSYGVCSTMEGRSDIDTLVDDSLRENPYLAFCTSGGNEGPGISSIGTPAAARSVITVAALLAADSARDELDWDLDHPVPALFSSRGGELAKPDIATPGYATSTVPRWVSEGDFWRGTSMASPYAAGLCAVLISHVQADHPNTPVRACDVKRALCLSASPLPNTTFLDVGYGVPDLIRAAEILDGLMPLAADDPVIDYDISTDCPHGPDGTAPAAYWRSVYFPTDVPQTFELKPVFRPLTDKSEQTSFTRRFELVNHNDWCTTDQEQVYLRNEQSASVSVNYHPDRLRDPGLYVGYVSAMHDGMEAWRLLNTIVVPHRATAENRYTVRVENGIADGWTPQRIFLAVPAGASAMTLRLASPPDARSTANMSRLFDPDGLILRRRTALDTDNGIREVKWTVDKELAPGVWEVCVVNDRPDQKSPFEFSARFFGLHAEPATITSWSTQTPGSPPSGEVTITNVLDVPAPAVASGRVEGFRQVHDDEFTGRQDTLEHAIELDPSIESVRLGLEMTKEGFAQTTDVGVMVVDSSGEAILDTALDYYKLETTFSNPDPDAEATKLTLRIRAGFAVENDERKTPITVTVDYLLAEPVDVSVEYGDQPVRGFVPGVPAKLSFACDEALPATPAGMRPVGYLEFRERGSDETMLKLPIDVTE